eukprot:GHVS01080133.1.p1 GENE.GHVS01080133.1~~GHVS01080133.1.p1  ORF type:complete len:391 (+),score=76.98 GHVS01080133.1:55-1227(+)
MTSSTEQPLLLDSPPAPSRPFNKSPVVFILVCLFFALIFLPLIIPHNTAWRSNHLPQSLALLNTACATPDYAKRTLKLTAEMSCLGWVSHNDKKFEASDVVFVNNKFYVVADNSWQLQQFDSLIHPFNPNNRQIQPQQTPSEDSSFEALVYDAEADVFYATREAMPRGNSFVGEIWQLRVKSGEYEVVEKCDSQFEFAHSNKGFEGMLLLRDRTGVLYLLGLCEGNHCQGGRKGTQKGNGRMVLMKRAEVNNKCIWETVKVLQLPTEIAFDDYSSVARLGTAIAITSQEESMLWIGRLNLNQDDFLIDDADKLQVLPGGSFFLFPRDNDCNVVYCNIEGISFITNRMLVAVSDQMKHGRQDFRCLQKDQSLHVFSLPAEADTPADALTTF